MCRRPNYVWIEKGPNWMKQPVSCRQCTQCREKRVDDFVGRMLCEAHESTGTAVLTLTYRNRDDLAEKVLTPRHFQAFVRSLRRRDHNLKCRYFVAGEYGDQKGRAHFHAILFFSGPLPKWNRDKVHSWPSEWKLDSETWPGGLRQFHCEEWPHGHVVCDWTADQRPFRYACKYVLKTEGRQSWVSMSKKPPLGWRYFERLADRAIELGVLPSSLVYSAPGSRGAKTYHLTGATRRDYLLRIYDGFRERYPFREDRLNKWVFETLGRVLLARAVKNAENGPLQISVDSFAEELAKRSPTPEQVRRLINSSMLEWTFNPWG